MLFGLILVFCSSIEEYEGDKSSINVGYFNMVKLYHPTSELYLSSIEVPYQTGSCQQVARGIGKSTLAETYWTVWPLPDDSENFQGMPVQCGSKIRLQHAATGKWLHSHNIDGHFGSGHEVSCFDEDDTGNNWELECNDVWTASSAFRLKHVDTGYYLSANISSEYEKELGGEHEIYCIDDEDGTEWFTGGGIFVNDEEDE